MTLPGSGSIEVICGSMFSGKTEELIRRLKRALIAKQKVAIYTPAVDIRYSSDNVVSHDENSIPSTPVEASTQILLYANDFMIMQTSITKHLERPMVVVDELGMPTCPKRCLKTSIWVQW